MSDVDDLFNDVSNDVATPRSAALDDLFEGREDYTAVPWLDTLLACRACSARDEARRVVPGGGPLDAEIAIIGQNPGEDEDAMGVAFVGRPGAELDVWLEKLQLDRDKVMVTNAVKCFPGDVRVEATAVERGYRRWYDGELVVARTRDGGELPGTSNHPVLTNRGWVPMGQLVQGDYLVRGTIGQGVSLRDPHVQGVPPDFAEAFNTLAQAGVREWVAGTDVDFHGDGGQPEVEVVTVDGLLRDRRQTSRFQRALEDAFVATSDPTGLVQATRTAFADALAVERRLTASKSRTMCRCNHLLACADLGTLPAQVERLCQGSRCDAAGTQPTADVSGRHAELCSERDRTLPRTIAAAEIVEIVRRPFAGHVYNLQTLSGEYVANGFIVHNCHTLRNRVPSAREITTCKDAWLRQEIKTFAKLRVVMPLGRAALQALLGGAKIPGAAPAVMQPWWADIALDTDDTRRLIMLPLPHPAYLLRSPGLRDKMYTDVLPTVKTYLEAQAPEVYARARRL
jgi:uracil-DNA glycosylase family 4